MDSKIQKLTKCDYRERGEARAACWGAQREKKSAHVLRKWGIIDDGDGHDACLS